MDVKATILAHESVQADSQELHRFVFSLEDALAPTPTRIVISLRTPHLLAAEVSPTTSFARMLLAIVRAQPAHYDGLLGMTFRHQP